MTIAPRAITVKLRETRVANTNCIRIGIAMTENRDRAVGVGLKLSRGLKRRVERNERRGGEREREKERERDEKRG